MDDSTRKQSYDGINNPVSPSLIPNILARLGLEKEGVLSQASLDTLAHALHDKNWQVRLSAVRTLRSLKTDNIHELLLLALNDENEFVRMTANHALQYREQSFSGSSDQAVSISHPLGMHIVPYEVSFMERSASLPKHQRTLRLVSALSLQEDIDSGRLSEGKEYVPNPKESSGDALANSSVSNLDRVHPRLQRRHWRELLLTSFVVMLVSSIALLSVAIYSRSFSVSKSLIPFNGQSFSLQVGGSSDAFNLWNNSNGPIPARTALPTNPGPYSVLGKPTITANFMNQILVHYNSPTAGMGQSLYDLGVQYGIDPVYAMAFFMHESLFGTTGEARVTLSLGNERCIPDRPCIDQNRGGYAQMQSWQDGFVHWYKLIRNLYVAQWGLVTVDQIIPRYAPKSDGNNEAEYIAVLKHEVNTWRAGILTP